MTNILLAPCHGAAKFSITALVLVNLAVLTTPVRAQHFPVTAEQKATAVQVAQTGVPLSELAANAPDSYSVKPGDTLWAISGLFLKSPWRWPELWGMNLSDIKNPHLIFPGQILQLEKKKRSRHSKHTATGQRCAARCSRHHSFIAPHTD